MNPGGAPPRKRGAEGLSEAAVETFAHYERLLREGERGTLPESELEPLSDLPDADDLPSGDSTALGQAVVLKLNGGLGTSMGMTKAKSLLEVKEGLTFLDVIVRQILWLRELHGAAVPLLLMNSFATRDDTLAALERYPDLAVDGLPLDFLQGRVPKLLEDGHDPVEWPEDPSLEWAPPGHGDVYTSLDGSGMLDELLERGYRYAFLSNSDNLGAVLDPRILDWVAREGLPFLSESTDRTEGDRKGGHLARRRSDGGLVLRETAQTPGEDWTVSTARKQPPVVSLDPEYFKLMGDFEPRFPAGPPSLVECERLTVSGDVTFGANVVVRGAVKVEGPVRVADGEVLEG